MTDMDEERKEKMKNFRVRLEQMNEKKQSVKPLDELKLEAEELDKILRKKLRASFTP